MKPKYSQIKKSHTFLAAGLLTAAFVVTPSVQAANWTGGTGTWSSNANPGWNGTAPNAVGAVANHGVSEATVTTQDVVGGVTVGTISLTNNSGHSWTFALTNGITLNQDNADSGRATISNTNSNASAVGLLFQSGTLTLADDLLISNTGASTRDLTNGGSIGFTSTSVIAGTGNITIDNVLNNANGNGSIHFRAGTNTFRGNVNVRSGATVVHGGVAFGNTSNVITLGAAGAGSASLLTSHGTTISNSLVVAAGSGGTLTLGSIPTSSSNATFGAVTLNDNLTIIRDTTNIANPFTLTSLSGTGGITKTGAGLVKISSASTYSGITTNSAGVLRLSSSLAMQNSALDTTASVAGDAANGLQIDSTTLITAITLGGLIGDKDLKSTTGGVFTTTSNRYSSITGLTLNPGTGVTRTYSGAITNGANNMTLTKTGLGTQVLSGTNTYSGATNVNAGKLVVNGSISTSSLTTVASGGTLGGSGTVGKTVISAGGTLAVGTSPGTMTFTNTLGLNGTTVMEIDGTAGAGVNPNGHDFISLTSAGAAGVLTYGGTLTLDIGVVFGNGSYSWDLFNFATETGGFTGISLDDKYSGTLTNAGGGVWGLSSGGNTWLFTESTGVLGLTVVPEPRAALLGSLGMLMLLRRRR